HFVDVAIGIANPSRGEAAALPAHDVLAAVLDQQATAFTAEQPSDALGDFERRLGTLTRVDRVVYAFAQLRLVARQRAALLPIAADASAASSASASAGRRGWRERRLKRFGARPRSRR